MKPTTSLLLSLCLLAGCTPQAGYVIEHSSPQYADGKYMYVLDGVTWQPLDSARIENSAFRIASRNKGSGIGYLYMGASSNPADLAQVGYLMFLEDGDIRTLPDSTFEFVYRGTPMNDAYTAFQQFRKTATADQQRDRMLELVRQNPNTLGCQLLESLTEYCTKTEMDSLMAGFPAEIPAGKLASFSPTWKAYGLLGIPANFLIDTSTGLIIAKNLRGNELDNYLAQLLP